MRLLLLGAAAGALYYVFRKPLHGQPIDNDALITKVRIKLDDLMEHPGSVNIEVHDGRVILTGPAAEPELRTVVQALRAMPGVRKVECRLRPHAAHA
ncbi:MAG TPA: BON domain-containing protein [Burkholderiales bacterium]|nr:BON domain-containing protein [Burkholderiales bacterium]